MKLIWFRQEIVESESSKIQNNSLPTRKKGLPTRFLSFSDGVKIKVVLTTFLSGKTEDCGSIDYRLFVAGHYLFCEFLYVLDDGFLLEGDIAVL